MEIRSFEISNFRSIQHIKLDVTNKGLIFVGKNEAGKSNILKAIAALFGEYVFDAKDYRKKIDDEVYGEEERYVRAYVSLSNDDIKEFVQYLKTKISEVNVVFPDKFDFVGVVKMGFGNFTLSRIIKKDGAIQLIRSDIDLSKILKPILVSNSTEDKEYYLQTREGKIGDDIFINWLDEKFLEYYKKHSFNCQLWAYKKDYVLPNEVSLSDFSSNPDICKPLKNLFIFCNKENIAKEFHDVVEQNSGDYRNLFRQISEKITKEFPKIWPDLRGVVFSLTKDGNKIEINIDERASYKFSDRSDGFKNFISIALMLSTLSRKGIINERNIILIDEPDQGLYPSGAKDLSKELKCIAEKSYVFYTTHSPYMIDGDKINRHIIVEKKKDITTIKVPDETAAYSDDELLRNAIGTTIFEIIKSKNIIFEGWTDKILFERFCDADKIRNIGMTHVNGVKNIRTLVPLINLAQKKFVIVADSDTPSNEKKKHYVADNFVNEQQWVDYGTVLRKDKCTLEDFFVFEYLCSTLKKMKYDVDKLDSNKTAIANITSCVAGSKEDSKERIMEVKQKLVHDAKKQDMKQEYFEYIDKVLKALDTI